MSERRAEHRLPAGLRLLIFAVVAVSVFGLAAVTIDRYLSTRPVVESPAAAPLTGPGQLAHLAAPAGAPVTGVQAARRTLVLYDEGGAAPTLGHQYAIQAANLASRGGVWAMRPLGQYQAGELDAYQAVIYVGTADQPGPPAFLADVRRGRVPVLWLGTGIERLFEADRTLAQRLGWSPAGPDPLDVTGVEYRGRLLTRRAEGNADVVRIEITDQRAAQVLGAARHADGSTAPWAVRSGNLTFVSEIPFAYAEPGDRYLALADLIARLVVPEAPDRRRALIRLEDVGPNANPADIVAAADYLSSRGVPFSLAVYPYYRDPRGAANRGRPTGYRLVDRPDVVDALVYATERGGTIIMHGLTHQHGDRPNPYTGTSGEDYEFYQARLDETNDVQLSGPVPQDSESWALQRLSAGRGEFVRVGLDDPGIFEFPHYTASLASYRAVHQVFGVRYDQGSYFDGVCPRGDCADHSAAPGEMFQQFFPYPVRDVYGSLVIPENLLSISEAFNNNPARSAAEVVANAEAMTVVRDGVASGFFHPYLGVERLAAIVEGIQQLGYTFVSPHEIID